ncbi:MAG: ATP-grasp domain-containing protein [Euryarchaeota archaeon]|nr:ATP-grasp domain-containing protein [Euryarchaeota archaeon]MBV1729129.1 ATP-grasp domain-containing protein [Methanobacterium sp.]MBU4548023.1 ATP-grasp domain-containing protein [Euryarchaeota archaeon]MBU4608639.1 ATP-grasp domain-containing protein [Euryarchaeota archaeon]MBV1754963.1 ATP-grasp domain-containing protein [Methanobacterium sp.]
MEKLLIVGVNTRPLAHSAYQLGYEIYSTSYFCTMDFNGWHHKNCILKQKPYNSCGKFEESFDPPLLMELSSPYIDEVDHIISYTGAVPEKFPPSKIIGNKKVENVENKYKLYQKLKNKFKFPATYHLSEIAEAQEIAAQFPEKKFIKKPVQGSGGYGIEKLKNNNFESCPESEFLLQEFISGENVSTSVLSTGNESQAILSSKQLYADENPALPDFIYGGNIAPYPGEDSVFKKVAQAVVDELNLTGSNGVDMVIDKDDIYLIEVNPRLHGTFECAEAVLGINMMDAHIRACEGELLSLPSPKKYAIKKILFAKKRSLVGNLRYEGVFDLPLENTIIEPGQPVVTLIFSSENLFNCLEKIDRTASHVESKLKEFKY